MTQRFMNITSIVAKFVVVLAFLAGPGIEFGIAQYATPLTPGIASSHPGHAVEGCASCATATSTGCERCMMGVDCRDHCGSEGRWQDSRPMQFEVYGPGEFAGPARYSYLRDYRLRPNDQIQCIYLITRRQTYGAYRLTQGDTVMIETFGDEALQRGTLERGLQIQPDGTITVRLLGQVQAAGLTVEQLRETLEEQYKKYLDEPAIDVTPLQTNTLAEDIRAAVGGQSGLQQQVLNVRVMPDGKIRLPGIGELHVQGLSLTELKREINQRYAEIVVGLDVEPILTQQAPHFVSVLGEVANPNRIELQGPTTVLSAIASAGGHLAGANMRQVVVLRRADDWRLVSTMLDLNGAVLGRRPNPADEIWVRDGDVIIVPSKPIQLFDNFVRQVFTDGIYGVVPFGGITVDLGNSDN